jgi:maltose O-acetyltransferase
MIISFIEKLSYLYGRLYIKSLINNLGYYAKSDISYPITVKNPSNLHIHKDCKIGPGCMFGAFKKITLGSNTRISSNCMFETGSLNLRKKDYGSHRGKPIHIESNVWIGMNSIILAGVTIKKNSFISAGSIVRRDIPENSLYIQDKIIKREYEE